MKRRIAIVIMLVAALAVYAGGSSEGGDGAFTPSRDVTWTCTSNPGGGSDIFTQEIKDIIMTHGISDANIVIDYVTDGGGEVGRLNVSRTTGPRANHTLLTFNSGDLMPMCLNTDNRLENFTPIALMAVDNHLILTGDLSKYKTFQDVLDALAAGERIVIAGSKGDDIETYNELIAELGVTANQFAYTTNDSTSTAITALLGGHVDLVLGKPAAAEQYVLAGRMKPILALSNERFPTELFKDAPTLSEFEGYNNVEVPVWRGVVGPKAMSDAAADYWTECLRQVSETEDWQVGYIQRNALISQFMDRHEAAEYMKQYQVDYLAKIGKDA